MLSPNSPPPFPNAEYRSPLDIYEVPSSTSSTEHDIGESPLPLPVPENCSQFNTNNVQLATIPAKSATNEEEAHPPRPRRGRLPNEDYNSRFPFDINEDPLSTTPTRSDHDLEEQRARNKLLYRRKLVAMASSIGKMLIHFLAVPILVLYTLAIVGCISTAPGLPNIYALKISNSVKPLDGLAGGLITDIRIGYFGLCVTTPTVPYITCTKTAGLSATDLLQRIISDSTSTSTALSDLIALSLSLQSELIPSLICISSILFILGLFSSLVLQNQIQRQSYLSPLPRPNTLLNIITFPILWLSIAFGLTCSLSLYILGSGLKVLEINLGGGVQVEYGVNILVLEWVGVVLATVFTVGITWFVLMGLAGEAGETDHAAAGEEGGNGGAFMSGALQP